MHVPCCARSALLCARVALAMPPHYATPSAMPLPPASGPSKRTRPNRRRFAAEDDQVSVFSCTSPLSSPPRQSPATPIRCSKVGRGSVHSVLCAESRLEGEAMGKQGIGAATPLVGQDNMAIPPVVTHQFSSTNMPACVTGGSPLASRRVTTLEYLSSDPRSPAPSLCALLTYSAFSHTTSRRVA